MKKMNIAIIGAGFGGLSTAKILKTFGYQVTVFDKESDVGGVWSASRRYPGLTTQNVKSTYCLSDFPYPNHYPEWPTGEQVQQYLESYAHHFNLVPNLRLNTEVTSAELDEVSNIWTVVTRDVKTNQAETHSFDYLVISNGIFSRPMIPDYPGAAEYQSAGGRLCHTCEFTNLSDAKGKDVLVIGYGKSSCDVAQALVGTAHSTSVIARHLMWKIPKRILNVLNYKHLFLTRGGEGLFKYIRVSGFEKFLHSVGKPIRNGMMNIVQWIVTKQCKLRELGMHPGVPLETIATSSISLVTEGFYENIASGQINFKKTSIERLGVDAGKPVAYLSTGEKLGADIVICGTGWIQSVPFLNKSLQQRITNEEGDFCLYRNILPVEVPRLAFVGYNSSFFSQLNCEVAAMWLADLLGGQLALPNREVQNKQITEKLAWMKHRTGGKHAKGTNIVPFSIHQMDELLNDMQLPLSPVTRFKQWFQPVDPADFAYITESLVKRYKIK
jgi:thioredoxin reductase